MNATRRGIAAAAALAPLAAAGPAAAQAGEQETAVARAVEALNRAMVAVDKALLEALTAPQLSYGHSSGRVETRKEFVDNLTARNSTFRFINLSDQTISLVGGTDAIVRHLLTAETENRQGQVTPVRIGVMQVWQRQSGDWKLLARQAYRL
jgi:aspartate/methionine/tyrosine aminotransferase